MAEGIPDTSTLILLGRIPATDALPAEPLITAITLAELSVGPLVAATDTERSARQAHVQQAEADFDPPSTRRRHAASDKSRHPFVAPDASRQHAPTTQ